MRTFDELEQHLEFLGRNSHLELTELEIQMALLTLIQEIKTLRGIVLDLE